MGLDKFRKNSAEIWQNLEIFQFQEVHSTNNWVKEYLKKNQANDILVLAEKQTHGRGRNGRHFYSNLDQGLYFSLGFSIEEVLPENITLYTIIAAVSMIQAIKKVFDKELKVKWVNDLFYRGKKVGGILTEAITDIKTNQISSLVVGIGVNLAGSFDEADELTQEAAGTLYEKGFVQLDIEELLEQFLIHFSYYHKNIEEKAFMTVYEKKLLGIGEKAYYYKNNKKHTGWIVGITDQGYLRVKNEQTMEIENLIADEIHFSSRQFVEN